jgi:ankyrin repeat protein
MFQFTSADTRALYDAAKAGDVAAIKGSGDAGADVNWANAGERGATALHAAADGGHAAAVAALLERGASPDAKRTTDLSTPLYLACGNGDGASAAELLRAGASADVRNGYGNTPMHAACMAADACTVQLLLGAPAAPAGGEPARGGVRGILPADRAPRCAMANKKGSTPLHFLLYGSAPPSAELLELVLAQEGADAAAADGGGATALHVAARVGHAAAARRLASVQGLDAIEQRDASGRCAAQVALEAGHARLSAELAAGRELPRGAPGSALAAAQAAAAAAPATAPAVPAAAAPPPGSRGKKAAPAAAAPAAAAATESKQKKKSGGFFSRKKA